MNNFPLGNETLVECIDPHSHHLHHDIWHLGNPLQNHSALFLLQWSLIGIVSKCIDLCLKPLGQCSIVSQILGGVIFGPSILGQKKELSDSLFPEDGSVMTDTIAAFGIMYFFFIAGVKMDPFTLMRTERKGITIGLSVFISTSVISSTLAFIMAKYVPMDKSLAKCLPLIATSQSVTAFVVITIFLRELKILNTDLGRLAMSVALFADVIGFVFHANLIPLMMHIKAGHHPIKRLIGQLLSTATLFVAIIFGVRPLIKRILRHSTKPINDTFISSILVSVLIIGLITEYIGLNYVAGPLLLGLAMPEGPPLGTALMRKMETLSFGFFYPSYLAATGLHINIFEVNMKSLWIVCIIVVSAALVKICAVLTTGYYHNVAMKKCFVMGLVINARGIVEISLFNVWKAKKLVTDQEFSLAVLSIVVVNAILTPLIKCIYDPSRQYYYSMNRSSMQHSKRESELRIMVCIHKDDNIPAIMNLLEASCGSEENTNQIIALALVELSGRSRPILLTHQPHETANPFSAKSTQIHNALWQYVYQHRGYTKIQSFTSISNYDTMHDDVCQIALDKSANILIMPFHKHWEIDGSVGIINRAIQRVNVKVLEKSPCSVGILIDRGGFGSSLISVSSDRPVYHVVMFFIGGADDAEALAYCSRMCLHQHVKVKIIWFLEFGSENSVDRKRDGDLINGYRRANRGNKRFGIIEEVIRDGEEMLSIMRKMKDNFELVMVGRDHSESGLLEGLEDWSECKELGVVGDMLASQDFETKASVLVVQQQRLARKLVKHKKVSSMPNPSVHEFPFDDADDLQIPRSESWTV
ncbi:hypothetical protein RIF29_17580 [Crotalaria pallida]|uniref:Cation/H+ exchanger domain-containing protein n=1 Tax=Crotalaria pallida TaxID=3830 RepID=A0AAN9FJK7_CROPI